MQLQVFSKDEFQINKQHYPEDFLSESNEILKRQVDDLNQIIATQNTAISNLKEAIEASKYSISSLKEAVSILKESKETAHTQYQSQQKDIRITPEMAEKDEGENLYFVLREKIRKIIQKKIKPNYREMWKELYFSLGEYYHINGRINVELIKSEEKYIRYLINECDKLLNGNL